LRAAVHKPSALTAFLDVYLVKGRRRQVHHTGDIFQSDVEGGRFVNPKFEPWVWSGEAGVWRE